MTRTHPLTCISQILKNFRVKRGLTSNFVQVLAGCLRAQDLYPAGTQTSLLSHLQVRVLTPVSRAACTRHMGAVPLETACPHWPEVKCSVTLANDLKLMLHRIVRNTVFYTTPYPSASFSPRHTFGKYELQANKFNIFLEQQMTSKQIWSVTSFFAFWKLYYWDASTHHWVFSS